MAVDREKFSSKVTEMIKNNPLIDVINQEVCDLNSLDFDEIIIATGPLTSRNLLTSIGKLTDSENLFYVFLWIFQIFYRFSPLISRTSL